VELGNAHDVPVLQLDPNGVMLDAGDPLLDKSICLSGSSFPLSAFSQ
jgi:hypothetical protein